MLTCRFQNWREPRQRLFPANFTSGYSQSSRAVRSRSPFPRSQASALTQAPETYLLQKLCHWRYSQNLLSRWPTSPGPYSQWGIPASVVPRLRCTVRHPRKSERCSQCAAPRDVSRPDLRLPRCQGYPRGRYRLASVPDTSQSSVLQQYPG